MKRPYLILLIVSLIHLAACENSSSPKEESANETTDVKSDANANYQGMKQVDLTDYTIPASLYIPDEKKGVAKITETAYGSVQIEVGDRFGLEIVPFGQSLKDKKADLANDLVYTVSIVEEDENYVLFEKSIKDSDIEAEYHFFMNVELDGELYELKSLSDKAYSKAAAEAMLKSAKTFSAKAVS